MNNTLLKLNRRMEYLDKLVVKLKEMKENKSE